MLLRLHHARRYTVLRLYRSQYRHFSKFPKPSTDAFCELVGHYKREPTKALPYPRREQFIEKTSVFATNDTSLNHCQVYGFDYDYTLVHYTEEMLHHLYAHANEMLIEKFGYPKELGKYKFEPDFAIRGLHYDRRTGYECMVRVYGACVCAVWRLGVGMWKTGI
jgi:hypothetical protein